MKEFKGKVAVVTGAASGIGLGIAEQCAEEGMSVVLADIDRQALACAEETFKARGAKVITVEVDVSKSAAVENLARQTLDAFGAVHLLFNNAGIGVGGAIWEDTLADCEWAIGVNLWGVIHGLRTFVPIMLKQDTQCHIVNTASMAGLMACHPMATYQLTKHAVVALTENTYHALAQRGAKIKTSVLCPGWVNTRILESESHRPQELCNPATNDQVSPENVALFKVVSEVLAKGMPPRTVAPLVFQAIREERFYILSHPNWKTAIKERLESILEDGNPPFQNILMFD